MRTDLFTHIFRPRAGHQTLLAAGLAWGLCASAMAEPVALLEAAPAPMAQDQPPLLPQSSPSDAPQALTPPAAQQVQQAPQPAAPPQQLWVYIDLQGVAHYAHEQIDSRYARFSMSPLRADDAPLHVDVSTPMPIHVGKQHFSATQQAQAQRRIQAQHQGYQRNAKHLHAAAKRYNVDASLLRAIASAESGFNPHAVSHKGAVGLMQIMPGTAERFGLSADAARTLEQKLKDPAINAPLAARYVRYLNTLFPGRTDLVLAAYNAGEGAVQRYGNKIPPYKETQNYVQTVMATYASLNPQSPRWAGDSTSTIVAGNEAAYGGSSTGQRVRVRYPGQSQ